MGITGIPWVPGVLSETQLVYKIPNSLEKWILVVKYLIEVNE
jgi:hypothetical protein